MGKVAIVWEFGGGLGHIQYDLPLAVKLQEQGHEVICVMKNVVDAERFFGPHGIKVFQTPMWRTKVEILPNTYNYAGTLYNLGYFVPGALPSIIKAWRNLFEDLQPDLIIADHAPTALLASRDSSIPRMLYGTGFFSPPRVSPMPTLIPWTKAPDGLLEHNEKKVVDFINGVLTEVGIKPLLEQVHDIFDVDEDILATFKELDHYMDRPEAHYWGPVISPPQGEKPEWPVNKGKKIFGYLKPSYPHIKRLIIDLQQVDASVLLYVPNLSEEQRKELHKTGIKFLRKPANMHLVCQESDLVICHGGHGTCAVAMLHGKPLALLPEDNQLEQILISYNLAKQGFGKMITTRIKVLDYKGTISTLLKETKFKERAARFAEKYKNFNSEEQVGKITQRCEEVINSR